MRCWADLCALSGAMDDDEIEAVGVASVLLASVLLGDVRVPRSWSRLRLHPAGCLVAAAMGSDTLTTGRVLAERLGLHPEMEIVGVALAAAINDCLLRPAQAASWSGRTSRGSRAEAVLYPGPRLLASRGEERERWARIW